jgi:iron complex transport system ATP-binding protein
MSAWSLREVTVRYAGSERPALANTTLEVLEGRWTAVVGPNGAGKSSLAHVLTGTLSPAEGAVEFRGRPLRQWRRRALAAAIGVVPQVEQLPPALTVREVVAMGRYPHLGPWQREGERDREAIAQALHTCDVGHLITRPVGSLSGGERQRVRVARALAQAPGALVLDEPTAALDLDHEMALFELFRTLVRTGTTVLLTTHHVNLAARYADRLVLVDHGYILASGTPAEVLTPETVERVYRWPIRIGRHPGPGGDAGAPQLIPLQGATVPGRNGSAA